ncbi:hypothetical protein [Hydrogenophaga sp. T2]|uniref:hypothetical protein n=1 Tax=Hydrogenophaga sp. T2 TaxID=3132823 RepID=UPI003CE77A23
MPAHNTLSRPFPTSLVPQLLTWSHSDKNHGKIFDVRVRGQRAELKLRKVGLGDFMARRLSKTFHRAYTQRNHVLAQRIKADIESDYGLVSPEHAANPAIQDAYTALVQELDPYISKTRARHFKLEAVAALLQRLDALVRRARLEQQLAATQARRERMSGEPPQRAAMAHQARSLFWAPPPDLLCLEAPAAPVPKVDLLTLQINRHFPSAPGQSRHLARLDDPADQQANEKARAEQQESEHAARVAAASAVHALQEGDPACARLLGVLQRMGELVGHLNAQADQAVHAPRAPVGSAHRQGHLQRQQEKAMRRLLGVMGQWNDVSFLGPRYRHITTAQSPWGLAVDRGRAVATTLSVEAAIGLQQLKMAQAEMFHRAALCEPTRRPGEPRLAFGRRMGQAHKAFVLCCAELMRTTERCLGTFLSIAEGLSAAAQAADLHPQDRLVLTRLAEGFLVLADGVMQEDLPYAQAYGLARQGNAQVAKALRSAAAISPVRLAKHHNPLTEP